MVEINVFLMKPKHQYHLSQWRDYVYGAQSWKERRLLCESMVVQIKRRTSILKMVERDAFSYETKASIWFTQWGECVYGAQSWKE